MDYLEERILASEFECSNDKRNILLIGFRTNKEIAEYNAISRTICIKKYPYR